MYKQYFGLKELPFSIAPDPRYLYMSEKHREALAHLLYGICSDGGFVLLTGEVGTGKTTVCRCLLEQIPENADVAFILNPRLTVDELLATVCDELRIAYPAGNRSVKVFVDLINGYLLDAHARGRRTILIIEEAQNLDAGVLEQIRLLTNLETNRQKLLQIVMLGQPELKALLARHEMRQLSQRITARYHLGALSGKDVSAYVRHRLAVAGIEEEVFSTAAVNRLYILSGGIPRLINLICDRALLGAYVKEKRIVDASILAKAAGEVLGRQEGKGRKMRPLRWLLTVLVLCLCAAGLAAVYSAKEARTEAVKKVMPQAAQTLQRPAEIPPEKSADRAYQELFNLWNIPYPGLNSACDRASAYGAVCLSGKGNIETIKKLNRPAVLKLFDTGERGSSALLKKIEGGNATIVIGTEAREMDVGEIEKRWAGDYTILWKEPLIFTGGLRPGARGPEVHRLEEQLALMDGLPPSGQQDAVYDERLAGRVKKFQLSRGLVPDGIVGPRTIMQLNTGGAGPKLLAEGG